MRTTVELTQVNSTWISVITLEVVHAAIRDALVNALPVYAKLPGTRIRIVTITRFATGTADGHI